MKMNFDRENISAKGNMAQKNLYIKHERNVYFLNSRSMTLAPKRLDYDTEHEEVHIVLPQSEDKPATDDRLQISEKDATVSKFRQLLNDYKLKLTALCTGVYSCEQILVCRYLSK